MRSLPVVVAVIVASAVGGGCHSNEESSAVASATSTASEGPAAASPGLNPADFDRTVAPCDDFYRFVNGGWVAANPVPASERRWSTFNELERKNQLVLRDILEAASQDASAPAGSERRKLGDFYASGMDEATIDALGAKPIEPLLAIVRDMASKDALTTTVAALHSQGVNPLFGFMVRQDQGDATRYIVNVGQGGLGLPDRDYYTRTDAKSAEIRTQYVDHAQRMFSLLGEDPASAARDAATVMAIETVLAEASMTNVQRRDPRSTYNPMELAGLEKLCPSVAWAQFFERLGCPPIRDHVNVGQPSFMKRVDSLIGERSLDDWKAYLRWNVVRATANTLARPFAEEAFRFNSGVLAGVKEEQPRWKRVVQVVDQGLADALGMEFAKRRFSPEAKRRAAEMVSNLRAAFRERLMTRDWMSEATRAQAIRKLDAIVEKIGYTDHPKDYSAMSIDRATYAANVIAARSWRSRYMVSRLGKPVDRTEWGMSPPTVNASYNPPMNEITFPAGILQAPYFDEHQDDALNYGGIGAVIGHELTHGFDDSGSKFDAEGNLKEWWTKEDREEFTRRTALVVKQFDGYVAVDDLHVNGKLTLGENLADLGGVTIAFHALQRALAARPQGPIDGFTPEQRFFIAWARNWRNNTRPEALRLLVNTDPHSPARFRAIGPLANTPEFTNAFGCPNAAAILLPDPDRAVVW